MAIDISDIMDYSKFKEEINMNTGEMISILEEIMNADLTKMTPDQSKLLKNAYTSNLSTYEVFLHNDSIVITSDDAYRNWSYYAGFEYIDADEYSLFRHDEELIAIYPYSIDRVSSIVDLLNGKITEDEE